MPWTLSWSLEAVSDLERLDIVVARRIRAKLVDVLDDPSRAFQRLKVGNGWKMRVGDWRVLATLSAESRVLHVKRIGKRSNIYR